MSIITEIEKNQKQVQTLNELSKRKVVEHNSLITSIAKMDKTPLKIFELAVSCIDTDNPPKDNTIYLSKAELFSFFSVSDNDKHSRFKEAIEKMQKQAFFEIKQLKDNQKDYEMTSIVPIPTVKWNSYNDEVMIQFNSYIMPYLIDLRTNFTQYAISDIMELNSKYSIILYKWLCMNYNQYEHYSTKGGRRNKQVEAYRKPSISVKELRTLTDTLKDYQDFRNFDKWILKKPLEEINEHTHFNVTYEKMKKGRNIDRIQFHITKKKIAEEINGEYKSREQDEAYLKSKEQKEQLKQKYFTKAMASPYTRLLNEFMLLFPKDFMDIETMANLQREVYPKYDELKEKRGLEAVKTHISYVSSKQEDYSKRNISQYLKKSIDSYLGSLAFKESK
ncbi:RepB family plasmid replication initiator protein [Lactococcus lactis]|uniref:RepB n=1 Tax=Lactococcus lactis subsp. lactis TaxID=1360 RepID=A0A0V8E098_LACLL|nr:RepB family plasmid replication initiator protein [Lactococcus lactis]KSU19294.1 RepB [Lactococcus lactis subsp. lactis]